MILVTNDDGIDAPGLLALRTALAAVDRTQVIAPHRNWSVSGHSKTLHEPLRITPTTLRDGSPAYRCTGAPSDCTAVGLLGFLKEQPALVASGINPTGNVGHDLTYSGTVAAAMEAAISNVPAFALSIDAGREGVTDAQYATAAAFAARLAGYILQVGLPPDTCLNVNVPAVEPQAIRGVQITRTGRRIYNDELIERVDPHGVKYYWIGGAAPTGSVDLVGTDLWALANHYISITPIHLDMTSHALIDQLQDWVRHLA
ncbi:MAG: 5'/3'-nucleotidase SurE [Anaerolineae bacterium]